MLLSNGHKCYKIISIVYKLSLFLKILIPKCRYSKKYYYLCTIKSR